MLHSGYVYPRHAAVVVEAGKWQLVAVGGSHGEILTELVLTNWVFSPYRTERAVVTEIALPPHGGNCCGEKNEVGTRSELIWALQAIARAAECPTTPPDWFRINDIDLRAEYRVRVLYKAKISWPVLSVRLSNYCPCAPCESTKYIWITGI